MKQPNTLRYELALKQEHVESYFIRANHPTKPLAFWLKTTILAPQVGQSTARSWCVVFDGETRELFTETCTLPFSETAWVGVPPTVHIGNTVFSFQIPGSSQGKLKNVFWNVTWTPVCSQLAQALSLYPTSKLVTPHPALWLNGHLRVGKKEIVVKNWLGMQGHNWGRAHPWEYAWGQCLFQNTAGEPIGFVEGFTGRIRIGRFLTPWVSAVVVRNQTREYRFDRLFDMWNQKALLEKDRWKVLLYNGHARMELEIEATPALQVCLSYANPDGRISDCVNSKLCRVRLHVFPKNEAAFEYRSEHTGALEFLRNHVP